MKKSLDIRKFSVPIETYKQELLDPNWKLKAENIRIRDKHACRICGKKKVQLDVHHLRYLTNREAWDYDDGDLVTLCHECHERLHRYNYGKYLRRNDYCYSLYFKGVGIVGQNSGDGLWLDVCWTTNKHEADDEFGRLWVGANVEYDDVRRPTDEEIGDFWYRVNKSGLTDKELENIIDKKAYKDRNRYL